MRRALARLAIAVLTALAAVLPAGAADPPAAAPGVASAPAPQQAQRVVEAFVREGCPHCAQAEAFLAELGREDPGLPSSSATSARRRPRWTASRSSPPGPGGGARVPAVYVGGPADHGLLQGGADRPADPGGARRRAGGPRPQHARHGHLRRGGRRALACEAERRRRGDFEIAFLAARSSWTTSACRRSLVMGLLDGFNPCSMWVLILMISLLAPLNDRKRMVAVAGTFVAVEGVAYFLMMAAWLNLFLLIGLARWSREPLGVLSARRRPDQRQGLLRLRARLLAVDLRGGQARHLQSGFARCCPPSTWGRPSSPRSCSASSSRSSSSCARPASRRCSPAS